MATTLLGRMQEFEPAAETISSYLERLHMFFAANDVPEAKRVPVLLSVIETKTFIFTSQPLHSVIADGATIRGGHEHAEVAL